MATLTNTKIKDTYKSLLKVSDNGNLEAGLQEITDGEGNASGVQLNTGGDLTASGTVAFGSLKDSGENITIAKFVDEADGIAGNDNDTSIPTSAAVKDYVDTKVTAEDLDFAGDSGTGAVDLDSQIFTIAGTANEIETSASGQTITIGLPNDVSISGNLAVDTDTLYVDATNNRVGIGTPSPLAKIHIASTNAAITDPLAVGNTLRFTDNDSTQNNGQITGTIEWETKDADNAGIQAYITSISTNTGLGNLSFATGAGGSATEAMRIDSSGNVGIGASSVDSKVHIESAFTPSASAQQLKIENTTTGQPSVLGMFAVADNGGAGNAGAIYFDAGADGSSSNNILAFNADHQSDNNYDLVLTGQGNVGIGTSSPLENVQISDSSNVTLRLTNTTDSTASLILQNTGSDNLLLEQVGGATLFKHGSTERMRIDSSGNVGIGVTPTSVTHGPHLEVGNLRGTVSAGTGYFEDNGGTNFLNGARPLAFGVAGSERMRIDSSGNVGIGTSSPADPFHLAMTNGDIRIDAETDRNHILSRNAGNSDWRDICISASSGQDQLVLDTSGNVGIGTSSPNSKLEVIGGASHGTGFTQTRSGHPSFSLLNGGTNSVYLGIAPDGGSYNTFMQVEEDGTDVNYLRFNTGAGTERMRIDSSGNVGIGTSPDTDAELHIYRNGSAARVRVEREFNPQLDLESLNGYAQIGTLNNFPLAFQTNGSERMRVLSTGGLTFNGDTAAANALDDYEEGTFTPTADLNCTINTIDNATYTKIGNMVFVQLWINLDITNASYRIGGLPFSASGRAAALVQNQTLGETHIGATIATRIFGYNATTVANDNMYIAASYRV